MNEYERAIADFVPSIVWVADGHGRIRWFNRRWYAYTGMSELASLGEGWMSVVHPDDLAVAQSSPVVLGAVDGAAVGSRVRMRGQDGLYRWFLSRVEFERDAAGNVTRMIGSNTEIDTELRAAEQMAFFSALGESLADARDLDATLRVTVRQTVPRFGDWAFVTRIDSSGHARIAAVFHEDPAKDAMLGSLVGRRYASALTGGFATLLASRRPILLDEPQALHALGWAERWAGAVFGEVGVTSTIVVPILHENAITATLHVGTSGLRRLARPDVPLLTEVGRRIGPAIARAEAFERERKIATTFQQAALPPQLPMVPGLDFAALYQPGSSDVQVGGDFYDAFVLPDGRVVLAVGDVSGSGLQAAVTMSEVRQCIRGAAAVNPDPAILLDAADRAVRGPDHGRFVTAWVGVLDPVEFTLAHASAGHQPPLLGSPDGSVRELDAGGLPLGLRGLGRLDNVTRLVELQAGNTLLLYTDGLTESTHDLAGGERKLRETFRSALADPATPAVERAPWLVEAGVGRPWRIAQSLREGLLDGGHGTDDVAIFVVEFVGPLEDVGVGQNRTFDADDSASASEARGAVLALLEAYGASERVRHLTEVAFSELVGNVARHAGGPVDVVLDMGGEQPVLHVLDRGPGFGYAPKSAVDAWSLDGRGLMIVNRLAADLSITPRHGGGTHVRFVVPERTHGAFRRSDAEEAATP